MSAKRVAKVLLVSVADFVSFSFKERTIYSVINKTRSDYLCWAEHHYDVPCLLVPLAGLWNHFKRKEWTLWRKRNRGKLTWAQVLRLLQTNNSDCSTKLDHNVRLSVLKGKGRIPARYVGEGGHRDQPGLVVLQDRPVEPNCTLASFDD